MVKDASWWAKTLSESARPDTTSFDHVWVGLEPTFSNRKAVRLWNETCDPDDELAYFHNPALLRKERKVAQRICERYREARAAGEAFAPFDEVEVHASHDPWGMERQEVVFRWDDGKFEVQFGLDPETFEYTLKPVPLAWLYEPRFVAFLQKFVWDVPLDSKLSVSMAHGGGQFSFSAKTFMQGSLLADDLAYRLDHPELSTWMLDFPNPDDRALRATEARKSAFERLLASYWAGGFHPCVLGTLRACHALQDRGFGPAPAPAGPVPLHTPGEVFRNNFAFGRAVRQQAMAVHPGYWQYAHPDEVGYRADQVMRYSEVNLNRLQIAGELHVKSGKVLDPERVPPFEAPLELSMLYDEAVYEMRAQMSRPTAEDFVDAVLLQAHHAKWLCSSPRVRVRPSLLQDQLLCDAERLLARRAPERLGQLRATARQLNAERSKGRFLTDWIEPETLMWEAWRATTPGERAEIAAEAVAGFVEHVENAASQDPRARQGEDPLQRHRHRVSPLLWEALEGHPAGSAEVRRELGQWQAHREELLARRPPWSVTSAKPPWA